jgi:hypothetical protein
MKHLLTHAPVLKIADPEADFLVCTDACKEGLGGVLMQGGSVICYESRKLNEHEVNYVTHDVEALPLGKKTCTYDRSLWIAIPI